MSVALRRGATWLLAVPPLAAVTFALFGLSDGTGEAVRAPQPQPQAQPQAQEDSLGEELYVTQCAGCHGLEGEGVEGRGPALTDEGEASVDFVLRTGRMPLRDTDVQAQPGRVQFSEEKIRALVEYAGAFGDGPAIPDVDVAAGDVAEGGELYRLNCAACHVASGAGAVIGEDRRATSLMSATPTEIGEAILIGPGAMPRFDAFTENDINDVAAYITELQERDTAGVDAFGGAGPVAEGLAAWLLALVPIIALTRWIGTPHEGRDVPVEEEQA